MKRLASIIIALILLCGTANATPIQITNGAFTVPATDFNTGMSAELTLESFHILGQNANGSYIVYSGKGLYLIAADAIESAIAIPSGNYPVIGALETITRGAKGDHAQAFQQGLKALGYLSGAADGDFGPGTEDAVRQFQTDMGLEVTGQADEITQLLVASLNENAVNATGIVDPQEMFAPILGRTEIDIQPIMDAGLVFSYDDIADEGFISDGDIINIDASGNSDLEKYEFAIQFGFSTWEENESIQIVPAVKVDCLCVKRPVMTEITIKSGASRGTAEMGELSVKLDGVYTVESGIALLDEEMIGALANADEELKLRVTGKYNSFDLVVEDGASASKIGAIAAEIAG